MVCLLSNPIYHYNIGMQPHKILVRGPREYHTHWIQIHCTHACLSCKLCRETALHTSHIWGKSSHSTTTSREQLKKLTVSHLHKTKPYFVKGLLLISKTCRFFRNLMFSGISPISKKKPKNKNIFYFMYSIICATLKFIKHSFFANKKCKINQHNFLFQ